MRPLRIEFKKGQDWEHTLTCTRADGTQTWHQLAQYFVIHDLIHYVVEKEMGWQKAFYGLVSQGVDISDFENPKDDRDFELTDEASYAEMLVYYLQFELSQGELPQFREMLDEACVQQGLAPFPYPLDAARIQKLRIDLRDQLSAFGRLYPGESLVLAF